MTTGIERQTVDEPVIEIRREDEAWDRDAETWVATAIMATLATFPDDPRSRGEIGVLLADDAGIADLNRRYRGKEGPTNVLSFPAPAMPGLSGHLGDLALARETVLREAREQRKTVRAHLTHLAVHGTLHLLGFDHEAEAEAEEMEALEREILGRLGLPDPYLEER